MRVVMPVAIPGVLRFRERTGADRFDEMWEGVLHMPPSPSFHHQSHASRIVNFFVEVWGPRTGGAAVMQINVSTAERWDQDYRIPDVSVMLPERVPQGEVMFVRPNVVFEVRSPGDETYDKLAFYAAVGVEAVVVVERDTKAVQVFALSGGNLVLVPPSADGWTLVGPVGVEVRTESVDRGSILHLRLRGEPETDRGI
jgi:Uma2 family endonuclease